MRNYAFGKTEGIYRFRNGGRLKIFSGFDHVPIIEVMMKKDYGEIPDHATIVDVGASTGVFAVYARATAKDVNIYAFEPASDYFATLKENVRLNDGEQHIKCFNMAVAGRAEKRNLTLRSANFVYPSFVTGQPSDQQQEVQCTTLERIFQDNNITQLDLLKMDCEGAEYEIFTHTPDHIMSKIQEIRMEYHNLDEQCNVAELRRILSAKNFKETYFKPTNDGVGNIWFRQAGRL